MEIKDNLKNDIDNYQIKTTSNDILTKANHKNRFNLSFFKYAIPAFGAVLALVVLVLMIKPQRPERTSLLETLAYSSVSSLESLPQNQKKGLQREVSYDVYELVSKTEALLADKIEITTVASDKAEYEFKSELTYQGNVYELYIENKLTKEEYDKDDLDEFEQETVYNGIVVYNEVEYRFEAKEEYEEENEGFSYEVETELMFKLYLSDTSYIMVDQEVETEDDEYEESFKYTKVVDGQRVSQYEVSKEIEDGKETLKYESSGVEYKLTFYKEFDNEYLKVKYNGVKDTYLVNTLVVDGVTQKTYTLV